MLRFKEVGRQIKNRRDDLKITQNELAELADISPNTLYKIERGQANPSLRILGQILDVLGLEIQLVSKSSHAK